MDLCYTGREREWAKLYLSFIQIGFIGLVEEEWLVTLATVDREEVTYLDFVTEGTKLAKELRDQVTSSFGIIS